MNNPRVLVLNSVSFKMDTCGGISDKRYLLCGYVVAFAAILKHLELVLKSDQYKI